MQGAIELSAVDERVRGLDVWLEWRTTSPEPTSGRTETTRVSLEGRTLGGRARPTFSCKLPRTPLSYGGRLFSIEWLLVVSVDVAWAKDPRKEVPITVGPSEHSLPVKPLVRQLDESTRSGVKLDPRSLALGITGSGVAVTILATSFGATGGIVAAMAGGGAFWLARLARMKKSARFFGAPSVVIEPGTLELGEPFSLRVVTNPAEAVEALATWRLVATEALTTGSGKARRTQRVGVHEQSGKVGRLMRTATSRDGFAQTTIPLRDATYASFTADRHSITWTLFVTLTGQAADGSTATFTHELDVNVRR